MAEEKMVEARQDDRSSAVPQTKDTPKRGPKKSRARKGEEPKGRGRGASTPFPPAPFLSVLPLAEAIQKYGAGQRTRRLTIFEKLNKSPDSGPSRMLITNSRRYGITEGNASSEYLELTSAGTAATSPESMLRDKTEARFKLAIETVPAFKFLYDRNRDKRVPAPEVLQDSLSDMNIKPAHRKQAVDLFLGNLDDLGLLRIIGGAQRIISLEQLLEGASSTSVIPESSDSAVEQSAEKVDKSTRPGKKTCFVIAPIDAEGTEQRKHSDMILESLVRRALEGEWDVIRADRITSPGMISCQVVEHLLHSGLVVADLSFHNPNVFYELALRHAVGKPTVHLIRKGDAIPFDLKDFRTITIDTNDKYELVAKLETYRAEIANHVRQAVAEGSDASNPVRTFAKSLKVTLD